ncbi:putative sugar kinase YdjH [Mycobacterium kansasii]|nr:sugar kinase [Mycobacterium kansasii]VAZ60948.1 putative sugar kinase YdjH [Mycobacterium kansasii]VAZ67272.1 putative sugar kinase YdjH [Mycobacterium kansasii]VAZ76446.1 putative sugar kinase YdjH [Mycobacterium kansasii]VTP01598.1 putative sugar kinase YdjH [Mycobacterium kansasii]
MRCRRTGPVIEWPRGFVALAKTAAIASSVPNMEKADRPMTRVEIAVVGVHVLDTHVLGITSIPEGSQGQLVPTIKISPAGTAGGTAVVLSRLGAAVRSFGAIGTDAMGDALLAMLCREGVDVGGLVRTTATQTSASVIPVRSNGDRPAWHCVGANAMLRLEDLNLDEVIRSSHLHLGGPEFLGGPAAGELLQYAKSNGLSTSVDILAAGDPGLLQWIADVLPHTDYLLPNDEQVLGLTGAADVLTGARCLLAAGAGCVAVTQGSKGAVVVSDAESVEVPAFAIDVVDTTGCGDAFSAGFILGRALGRDLREAARLGCATAAHVASGIGTDAGAYDFDVIEAFASGDHSATA